MRKLIYYIMLAGIILVAGCNLEEPQVYEDYLKDNFITAIYIDDNGIKWFGTVMGLCSFDGSKWKYYTTSNYLPGDMVHEIASRKNHIGSEIWVATRGGISALTVDREVIQSATIYTEENSDLIGQDIYTLEIDDKNNLWFGTDKSISVLSDDKWLSDTGIFRAHPALDIGSDKNGFVFLATAGAGVVQMELKADAISTVTYYEYPWSPVPYSNFISNVYVDNEGTQWYGTYEGLLKHTGTDARTGWTRYDMENDGLPGDHIYCVTGDHQGIIWIGTRTGAASYDGSEWTIFTVDDGMISNKVHRIAVDIDGSVWFGTNNGVSHLQGRTWTTYQAETPKAP